MAKRFISALLALVLLASPVLAANQKPSDVPTPSGPTTATYAPGTTLNELGNGTYLAPDTPPWYASMPADIPDSTSGLINIKGVNDDWNPSTDYIDATPGGTFAKEAKFRSHLITSHVLYDDPIRNYGEPGTSHCHQFFGNMAANAFSTFASLRNRPKSSAAGDRKNGTAYWAPCLIKTNPFGDSKNYVIKMTAAALYYTEGDSYRSQELVALPFGLRYVGGMNMDDPEDTTRRREVVVANAQPGTSGRYTYTGNGFNGWRCINGDGVDSFPTYPLSKYLKSPTGADPFGGMCTMGTGANAGKMATIIADFNGPNCWNGIDPWVPGGYDHMRNSITDGQRSAGFSNDVCPRHWYRIPPIRLLFNFSTRGFSDYGTWRLASDDGMQSKINGLPTCTTDATGAYANAPCATRSSGGPLGAYWNGLSYVIPNGVSFHTDWFGGWDGSTMKKWMAHCLGVRGLKDGNGNINASTGSAIDSTPHTCETSIISSTERLSYGPYSDGRSVSLSLSFDSNQATQMFRVRTVNPSGMGTYHVH